MDKEEEEKCQKAFVASREYAILMGKGQLDFNASRSRVSINLLPISLADNRVSDMVSELIEKYS